jgi:chromosomal replication initiator protein
LIVSELNAQDHYEEPKRRYTPPLAIHIDGMDPETAWEAAKGQLQAEIDKVAFDTWVKDVQFLDFEEGAMKLGVANDYAKQWLEDRLSKIAERVLAGIVGERVVVRFTLMYEDD